MHGKKIIEVETSLSTVQLIKINLRPSSRGSGCSNRRLNNVGKIAGYAKLKVEKKKNLG